MFKVKFIKPYAVKAANPVTGARDPEAEGAMAFKEGDVVDFYELYAEDSVGRTDEEREANRRARAEASVRHFVNRGVAVHEGAPEERRARAERGVQRAAPAAGQTNPPQPGQPQAAAGGEPRPNVAGKPPKSPGQ